MTKFSWTVPLLLCGLGSLLPTLAKAQQRGREPHLAYAYPAGCQRGTTREIVLGGQHIKNVEEAFVSLSPSDRQDVHVEILDWYRPLTKGEYQALRRKLQEGRTRLIDELKQQGENREPTEQMVAQYVAVTTEDLREMQIHRDREADIRRQPNEQLDEQLRIRVTVDDDADIGKRELRVLTDAAMSNPLWLHVGHWPERLEVELNASAVQEALTELPAVVNGQITPGDVDRFSFHASKGMSLVLRVDAREVIPYLADAVPGWFEAHLRLLDQHGKALQVANSFYFRQDPMMLFEVPEDGVYTAEVRDSIYRGREDFVYRLTVGAIPVVTSIFPMGARVGSSADITLAGWNLTKTDLTVQTMPRANYRPIMNCRVRHDDGIESQFQIRVDQWPEAFDNEPNQTRQQATKVSWPVTINGRIDHPGDIDVYQLEGAGRLVAEIEARSLGSPLDSMLHLIDKSGATIAKNDDHEDLTQSLLTHHSDSRISAVASSHSTLYLIVSDAQNRGGQDHGYRLQIRQPKSDFDLRVTPSNIVSGPGRTVPITVHVMRQDGFDDEIEVNLIDPPEGFRLSGNRIPAGTNSLKMTLTLPRRLNPATSSGRDNLYRLRMQGQAWGRGSPKLIREVIPAEDMMQAFIWHHLLPVEHWSVMISQRAASTVPFELLLPPSNRRDFGIRIDRKKETHLPIAIQSKLFKADNFQLELIDPPAGLVASIVETPAGPAIRFRADGEASDLGKTSAQRGNLLIGVFEEGVAKPSPSNPSPKPRRIDYGLLPAIPYQLVD